MTRLPNHKATIYWSAKWLLETQGNVLRYGDCRLVVPNCRIYLGMSNGGLTHKEMYYITVIAVSLH